MADAITLSLPPDLGRYVPPCYTESITQWRQWKTSRTTTSWTGSMPWCTYVFRHMEVHKRAGAHAHAHGHESWPFLSSADECAYTKSITQVQGWYARRQPKARSNAWFFRHWSKLQSLSPASYCISKWVDTVCKYLACKGGPETKCWLKLNVWTLIPFWGWQAATKRRHRQVTIEADRKSEESRKVFASVRSTKCDIYT